MAESSKQARRTAEVAAAAQLACLLEATAPKPGNVSPGHDFADLRYEDFLASAIAIGAPLAEAGARPLGETILRSVEATSRWVESNTNLGIVLLLAPLARAALLNDSLDQLRSGVEHVLHSTTVDDARNVYAAIRLAAPGGLGRVDEEDVAGEPTVTLLDAMTLAADRDDVAREYATGFSLTFECAAPALEQARSERLSWSDAIVETFLTIVARRPDTHIARRGGARLAAEVSARAQQVFVAGGVRTSEGQRAITEMDAALRTGDHLASPGTAADLTAAAIFVVLLGGGWDR